MAGAFNHLDLAACEWLEGYLADYPGLILVVSHDRYFTRTVATRFLEIRQGRLMEIDDAEGWARYRHDHPRRVHAVAKRVLSRQ